MIAIEHTRRIRTRGVLVEQRRRLLSTLRERSRAHQCMQRLVVHQRRRVPSPQVPGPWTCLP